MRIGTIAAAVGIVTGVWTLGVQWICPSNGCPESGVPYLGTIILSLSVLLILASVVGLVGSKNAFYGSAILSILLDSSVALTSGIEDAALVWITLGLSGATFVLSLAAARMKTSVSEESHPMNLPVFG